MEVLHQTQLNSFLLSKIKFVLIFSALYLSSNFIVPGIFAKEEIRYVKGLGAVLREQPSIQSKKLTKLSRGTKVLALEVKGIWHKVIAGKIQGWLLRGQITNIPVKIKNLVLGQKIRLTSSSGRRVRLRTFSAIVGVKVGRPRPPERPVAADVFLAVGVAVTVISVDQGGGVPGIRVLPPSVRPSVARPGGG